MKRRIVSDDYIYGMANLVPKQTGLSADIWADHKGVLRAKSDVTPRVKISVNDDEISISIEKNPVILAGRFNQYKKSVQNAMKDAIKYVGRNYDLFLRHYNDVSDEFTDRQLEDALIERGEFKA